MGPARRLSGVLLLLLGLAALSGAAPSGEDALCPRGCRCFAAGGEAAANCSSPAAALALGERLRVLRLSRYDDHLSVKEGAFRALSGLRELHLDHLGLVKVYPGAFHGLVDLETLDLSHNALSVGDELSRALRDLPVLRRLSLRGNNFGSNNGAPPALASRTLKFVDLGRCKLRDLPSTVLAGLSHVRHVVLDGNFIRNFQAEAFPRSVVSIDLSHNDIEHISRVELNKLENVDTIELSENPLHCTCDLLKISYDYNMNKPVVCAYPKQLMGKDLMKVKKHQVCGGHKKVKREAGNELDDEELSAEGLENDEDVDQAAEEAGVEDTSSDAAENSADKGKLKQTPDDAPETLENEETPKEPSEDDVREAEEPAKELPAEEALPDENTNEDSKDLEDDAGPEDIDGPLPARHIPEDTENLASDDIDELDETEREGGHIIADPNPGPPPEEEEEYESETKEIDPSKDAKENQAETKRTGDGTGAVGYGADEEDSENTEDEVDNTDAQNAESAAAGAAVGEDAIDADGNSAHIGENAETQVDTGEQDPPDSLSPSEYNHVQAANGNQNTNNGDAERENTGEETADDLEENQDRIDALSHITEDEDDVEEEGDGNSEVGAASVLEAAGAKEESNEDAVENAEVRAGDENMREAEEENSDVEDENVGIKNTEAVADTNDEDSKLKTISDGDETDSEQDSDVDAAQVNDEHELFNFSLNAVNNEDILPGSEVYRKEIEQEDTSGNLEEIENEDGESQFGANDDGEDDTGLLKSGTEVERVRDSPNVVHTNDVGARAEEETPTEDDDIEEDADDTEDNAENTEHVAGAMNNAGDATDETEEEGDTEIAGIVAGANEGNTKYKDNVENAKSKTVLDNNAEDGIESEDEDSEDDGNDETDIDVLTVAGGDDTKDEVVSEDEDENENYGVAVSGEAGVGETDVDFEENEDANEDRLEEELKEDRSHSTLGHEDLDNEANENVDAADAKDHEDDVEEEENPIVPMPIDSLNGAKETDDDLGNEDVEEEESNQNVEQSPADTVDNEDILTPNEYEAVRGRQEADETPGGSLSLAPADTEDSDEDEGSGSVVDAVDNVLDVARDKDDDWAEKSETPSEKEDEAVPPLRNAESEEREVEEGAEDTELEAAPSLSPPLNVLGVSDNVTEDESETGSGAIFAAGVPIGREDEETASNEDDEGSGQPIVVAHAHTTEQPSVWEEADETEDDEGSGKGTFIAFNPERDAAREENEDEDGGLDETDEAAEASTAAPLVPVEEEVIAKHDVPVVFGAPPQGAPPRHEETAPPSEDDDDTAKETEEQENAAVDRSNDGRALFPSVDTADDGDQEESGNVGPFSPPEDGHKGADPNVELVGGVSGDIKGNVAASPDSDGSEALNKDEAISMNTIGSYIVLGAIMLIVVILLAVAVCRSRRQKSAGAREKDVENPGREMHDVNKPLINNHHPSGPEKQPLDETQQPLMTKEQEASLTVEPPEKKPLTDKTDGVDHKPHQNGGVPEVVVERNSVPQSAAVPVTPTANGKAASPAAERAPSPAAPVPAPAPSPAPASPAPSPTADGHANGNAVPLANGGSVSPGAAPAPASSPAAAAPPVSPGAVRVVAKELPDSVAKRPVIIMNRGAEPAQQV